MAEQTFDILQGIRIVDAGGWLAGTGASALLGDIGAEVIKIEEPIRGDSYRGMAKQYGDIMSVKGRHIGFEMANLNKLGVTLDLRKQKGREILYELVKKCDVFHTNFTKDAREKLEVTYEKLKTCNPTLIYCSTSGFGSRGPSAGRRAYDTLGQAQSGIMWAMGDRDFDEPVGAVGAPLDQLAATLMAFGMVCALLGRERFKIAQEVQVSLLGSGIHLESMNVNMALLRGRPYGKFQRRKSPNPLTNNYRCSDGKWIMLAEPVSDVYWGEFCKTLGLDVKDDPRYSSATERSKNCEELIKLLDKTFATRTRDEWIKIFNERKVGFAYAPILDIGEAVKDRQVLENDLLSEFNHPVLGLVKMAGFPALFSKTPAKIRREAPELGQHTEQVLIDILGYDWDKIAALKDEGVI